MVAIARFLKAVLPIHNQDLRQSTSLKQPYESTSLDAQTEYVLAKLINA